MGKDRTICFLLLFYARTVLFGLDSLYKRAFATCHQQLTFMVNSCLTININQTSSGCPLCM